MTVWKPLVVRRRGLVWLAVVLVLAGRALVVVSDRLERNGLLSCICDR